MDFVILVDDKRAREWWRIIRMSIKPSTPRTRLHFQLKKCIPGYEFLTEQKRKRAGWVVVNDILKIDFDKFITSACGKHINADTILMPEHWRDGININRELLKDYDGFGNDEGTIIFFKKIIHDMRRML